MVKHIVLWKLKPEFKSKTDELVRALYGMKSKIAEIIDIEAGADFVQSERSYDLAVVVTLKDRSASRSTVIIRTTFPSRNSSAPPTNRPLRWILRYKSA
jgi:5,10-methylenetetrahydrofolate reductase